MFQLSLQQIKILRLAIVGAFPGQFQSSSFAMFLSDELTENLTTYTSVNAPFPMQVQEVLVGLNGVNKISALLDALEKTQPVLAPVIGKLRAPLPAGAGGAVARLQALEQAYLLLDGLPFINRGRLVAILDDLLDLGNPARVGIVSGAALAGKSWSLHGIRAFCKRKQPKVRCIPLDLDKLQPGNDPLVVWEELMRRLLYPQSPPGPPPADTKGGQYVQRLVNEVCNAWDAWEAPGLEEKPRLLIVFDHLEKNAAPAVGPAVVDFAEALAMAAVEPRLEGGRVLLLGFPRGFSPPELHVAELAPREDVSPLTLVEVRSYLADVGAAIGRGAPPEIEAAADLALHAAGNQSILEERRAALVKMSATIGRHVSVLARA